MDMCLQSDGVNYPIVTARCGGKPLFSGDGTIGTSISGDRNDLPYPDSLSGGNRINYSINIHDTISAA